MQTITFEGCDHIVMSPEDYEALKKDAERWQDRAERCGVAMALFAAAIKSGEPWTDECQRALDAAMKD